MPAEQHHRKVKLSGDGKGLDPRKDSWAVLLVNMGGPESTNEVKEYLRNIFSDKAIIKLPLSPILQWPLSRVISHFRAKGSAEKYRLIGGGSPLLGITNRLSKAVETELRKRYPKVSVHTAMRYTKPFIHEQLDRCKGDENNYVLIVPLYPQYCHATTGTVRIEAERYLSGKHPEFAAEMLTDFHNDERYIQMMRSSVEGYMSSLRDEKKTRLVFSAHSVPQSLVDSGDPYVDQIKKSSELIADGRDYIVSFQSRTGPVKWVGPDTIEAATKLREDGYGRIVVVPISFVADNLETLYDIDILLKEHCDLLGIELHRIHCPNDSPDFSDVISRIVADCVIEWGKSERYA